MDSYMIFTVAANNIMKNSKKKYLYLEITYLFYK